MLQTFLILREQPAASTNPTAARFDVDADLKPGARRYFDAADLFSAAGYRLIEREARELSPMDVQQVDAIILQIPFSSLIQWTPAQELPLIWWCENEPVLQHCNIAPEIDCILHPGLTVNELNWSLSLASRHYLHRTQWRKEREQLLAKLEDRKWIERAKSILSEMKRIPEAEAYEFLRKQAMNERRRIADVAASIVQVYSLIKDQNPKGRSR